MSGSQPSQQRGESRRLTPVQQRAWLAYIRVELRMNYEMHRQLQSDSGLSLSDYHILVALTNAPHARMRVADLAAQIGWERSRVSHHVRRMCERGLVTCGLSAADRRGARGDPTRPRGPAPPGGGPRAGGLWPRPVFRGGAAAPVGALARGLGGG